MEGRQLGPTDDFDFDFDPSGIWWLGAQFAEEELVLVNTETSTVEILATAADGLAMLTAAVFDPSRSRTAYVTSGSFAFDGTGSPPSLMQVSWETCRNSQPLRRPRYGRR